MHIIRETEQDTQERVIKFFKDVLDYSYLGNWADSIEERTSRDRTNPLLRELGQFCNKANASA